MNFPPGGFFFGVLAPRMNLAAGTAGRREVVFFGIRLARRLVSSYAAAGLPECGLLATFVIYIQLRAWQFVKRTPISLPQFTAS